MKITKFDQENFFTRENQKKIRRRVRCCNKAHERNLIARKRELEDALNTMAELVLQDTVYTPVFNSVKDRLKAVDAEFEMIAEARKIVDQMEMKRKASAQ